MWILMGLLISCLVGFGLAKFLSFCGGETRKSL